MSSLRVLRDTLRPLISPTTEYKARRVLASLAPKRHVSSHKVLVHAALWKTASQWVRLILSDPGLIAYGAYQPFVYSHMKRQFDAGMTPVSGRRMAILCAYDAPSEVNRIADLSAAQAFFVVRDPRTMFVSWYASTRFIHVPTPGVAAHREAMVGLSEHDALLYMLDAFEDAFFPLIEAWLAHSGIRVFKFEELTRAPFQEWRKILSQLDIAAPDDVLKSTLDRYRIEKLQKRPGSDGEVDKYSAAGQRDWRTDLGEGAGAIIGERLSSMSARLGYGVDP